MFRCVLALIAAMAGCSSHERDVSDRSTGVSAGSTSQAAAMTFDQTIDAASRFGAQGQVGDEVRVLQAFLTRALKSPEEESRVLSKLSSAQLRSGDTRTATLSVRRALEIAKAGKLEEAEAEAQLRFATLNFSLMSEVGDVEAAATMFGEGFEHAEVSAKLYERLGSVNFLSVLLTMAEGARHWGKSEVGAALYHRVLSDSANPLWSQRAELQGHLRALRARADYGLAGLEILAARSLPARHWLEECTRELSAMSSKSADDVELIEQVAVAYEEHLGNPGAATRTRALLR